MLGLAVVVNYQPLLVPGLLQAMHAGLETYQQPMSTKEPVLFPPELLSLLSMPHPSGLCLDC